MNIIIRHETVVEHRGFHLEGRSKTAENANLTNFELWRLLWWLGSLVVV